MKRVLAALLVVLLLATPVVAHVPSFPEDNTTPENAIEVPDPVKSWSFYDSLSEDQVTYYRVTVPAGERLFIGTFTPRSEGLTPSIVVMGPGLEMTESVPAGVTVPEGMGAIVIGGERPLSAAYEPFTPSANYHTASFDQPVTTERTYVIAIYEPGNRSGPVGVTIGYEEAFAPTEYLGVPFDRVRIHLWEGQHPLVVFGPFLLTLLGGIGLVRTRWRPEWDSRALRLALAGGGLLLLGTGVNTGVQMVRALLRTGLTPGALVTAVFILIPVLCGGWALPLALQRRIQLTTWRRVVLALTGVLGLVTWAGFIVGPSLLLGVAVLPRRLVSTTGS